MEEKDKILILQHSFNALNQNHEKLRKEIEIEQETTKVIISEIEDHKILFSTALKLEKVNPKASFGLYHKAALSGNIKSMNNLGIMYESGRGTMKNIPRAIELYTIASEKGNSNSMSNLARIYLSGNGVKKDVQKAISLYKKSFLYGNSSAKETLKELQKEYPQHF